MNQKSLQLYFAYETVLPSLIILKNNQTSLNPLSLLSLLACILLHAIVVKLITEVGVTFYEKHVLFVVLYLQSLSIPRVVVTTGNFNKKLFARERTFRNKIWCL